MQLSPSLRRWFVLLVLLVVVFLAAFIWARPLLNIGTGYAAKHACSCHFLQGRDLDEISKHDLNFSVLGMMNLSKSEREVRAGFFGLTERRAVFRPGVGCTLINDETQPLVDVSGADVERSGIPHSAGAGAKPDEEAVVTGPAALQEALDFGMAPVPGGGARGLVVLQNGGLIAERYADGYGPDTRLLGWSMTKTLTALVMGRHRDTTDAALAITGLINRDHLFPEIWADSARQEITLADLLHMNSGLLWNEAYGSLSDATIMLHEHADMAEYAYSAPAVVPRGTQWVYSSGTTNILAELIDRETETNTFNNLYREILHPVAPSLLIEPSQAGLPVGSSYGWATARDWARLGQFMLQGGVWDGDTLLYPGWIDYLRQPAAGSDGIYGGQTWLPGPDVPSLPKDAFMMRGFQDQRVFVIPSRQIVIARLGHGDDKSTDFEGLVERILRVL